MGHYVYFNIGNIPLVINLYQKQVYRYGVRFVLPYYNSTENSHILLTDFSLLLTSYTSMLYSLQLINRYSYIMIASCPFSVPGFHPEDHITFSCRLLQAPPGCTSFTAFFLVFDDLDCFQQYWLGIIVEHYFSQNVYDVFLMITLGYGFGRGPLQK